MSINEHRCGRVALMGPPNAGKSTLLNSFLGQKVAIVTPKPQTTRNQISGILSDPDAQVIFLDTPGVHQLKGKMNRVLLQSAWQAMSSADMVVVILDTEQYVRSPEIFEKDMEPLREAIIAEKRPVAVALNKVDLFHDKSRLLPLLTYLHDLWPSAELFPLSAMRREGLPELLNFIKQNLPVAPAEFPADQLSTAPLRFMVAEIIREKLFLSLKQELPYYTAVEIERWEDVPQRDLTIINAVIYVGRSSHKGMVIGKSGVKLKDIGTAARQDIEKLLDHKVHLELWVKVREGWSEDPSFLQFMSSASDALLPLEEDEESDATFDASFESDEDFPPHALPEAIWQDMARHMEQNPNGNLAESQMEKLAGGLEFAKAPAKTPAKNRWQAERNAKPDLKSKVKREPKLNAGQNRGKN